MELAEGIEGLCHVSEIEERKPKGEREKEKAPRAARVTSVLNREARNTTSRSFAWSLRITRSA